VFVAFTSPTCTTTRSFGLTWNCMISSHFVMPMLDEPTNDVSMSLNECHHMRVVRSFGDVNAFIGIRNLYADLVGVLKYLPKQWVA
jgi:hypothetical protein